MCNVKPKRMDGCANKLTAGGSNAVISANHMRSSIPFRSDSSPEVKDFTLPPGATSSMTEGLVLAGHVALGFAWQSLYLSTRHSIPLSTC
jgi:hypothetical protein